MKEFLWKYGLIIFLMISMSVLAYQKETKVTNDVVPNQTVVISAILKTGRGIPIIIRKGLLNPENEGKKWLTLENFLKSQSKINNLRILEANK